MELIKVDEWSVNSIYEFINGMNDEEKKALKKRHDLSEDQLKDILTDKWTEIDGEKRDVIDLPKFESDVDEIREILEIVKDDDTLFHVEPYQGGSNTIIRYIEFELEE